MVVNGSVHLALLTFPMGVEAAVILIGIACGKLGHLGTNQHRPLKAQRLAVLIEVKHAPDSRCVGTRRVTLKARFLIPRV